MFARQRGATFLGIVIIGGILAVGVYAVMRLWPAYFEYMEVVRAMEQTAKENKGDVASVEGLRKSLDRRWTVEDIKTLDYKDIQIKRAAGNGYTMRAYYRYEAPFMGNVGLIVTFDKTVDVR